jgi:general secretion pathway protein F
MRFEIKAYKSGGTIEALSLEAESAALAARLAETGGYSVLSVRARGIARFGAAGRAAKFPLALFSQELSTLLEAGLPLTEAIETLGQKEREPASRAVLEALAAGLKRGMPLSGALEQQRDAFPPLYVAVVRSSEKTGGLAEALSRFVGYERQVDALRSRIVNASIYPLIITCVGAVVMAFLLFYVMPKFSHVYDERALNVGLAASILLALGGALEGKFAYAMLVLGAAAAAVVGVARSPRWRAAALARLSRAAVFGERLRTFQLARFYRTAGMLLRGGFPVTGAFGLAGELLDPALRARLARAVQVVSEGQPVSGAMAAHGLSTPIAARLLAVGEQGGNMGEMMLRIADFHDEETARWVDWFTRLFEPLLMTAIGILIGAVVLLMYMPIFDLAGSLQ